MTSKDKLLREIETIRRAIGFEEPEQKPINWEYYLSQEDIDFFRSIKPKLILFNQTGQNNFIASEQAFLDKLSRIYIKERSPQQGEGIH